MGKSNTASNAFLNLVFLAEPWANIADNAAAAPLAELFIALHLANPTASGNQSTAEVNYAGYSRVAIVRSNVGWVVSLAESISPVDAVTFPTGTGGSGTAEFFSVGFEPDGPGEILYSGPISPGLPTGAGIAPELSTVIITES